MSAVSLAAPDRGTLRAQVRKYTAILRINLQSSLAYVWDVAGSGLFVIIFIFIFSQLWQATFSAQGATRIGGLTLNQTLWYFVWAELLELSRIAVVGQIQQEVKDGSLAYTLGRPYNYLLYQFFAGLGGVTVRGVFLLIFGGAVALIEVGPLHTFQILTVPAVLLITLLAATLDYCISAGIGLLAFFFEDTSAFRLIYQKFKFVLGGLLIPVDFLPHWLQTVTRLLPFNLTIYAPSKLFVDWDGEQFLIVLGLQILWLFIIGGLLALLYRYGARRLSINGG